LWWALAANPADTLGWDFSIDRLAPQDRKGEQPAGIDLTKRGIARDLVAPEMAIGSNPLSSTRKSARAAVGFVFRELFEVLIG